MPLHDGWSDDLYLRTSFEHGMVDVVGKAPVVVEFALSTARQTMHPMDGKGLGAWWDFRAGQLVVYTSTQIPHMIRVDLAECLGFPQAIIRIAPPDVGGGFGYKCMLMRDLNNGRRYRPSLCDKPCRIAVVCGNPGFGNARPEQREGRELR